ncbi:MAG: carbohydrate-binding protein [Paludibacteraceae bacterium]|nr:carbohydrate-binding protein [Paludibacteraceae bacterium]
MRTLYKSVVVSAIGAMLSVSAVAQSLPGVKSTISVNGKNRTIDVYAPSGMGENRPMVISAHGMGQDIAYQKENSRWDQVADTAKFLVVYPQSDGSTWDLSASGADIAFIKAIIKEMSSKYKIDLDRVYMSGFSMGGMLTYSVANCMADQIAACAPVSGYPIGDLTAKPSRPMPIIHTNGDKDDVVHYEPWKGNFNGMYQEQQGAYAQAEAWAKANQCDATPVESVIDGAATRYLWKNGKCGVEVCLNKVYGKGHWPSNDKYHSVREIWKFISRFSLNCGEVGNGGSSNGGGSTVPPVNVEAGPYNGSPASIPGTIEAEEYDFGGQGVAYNDKDEENRGEAFRNDGIDIYKGGTGFVIGYNQSGEWMNYTVDVKETSRYTVTVSAATDNASASFQLLIDGKEITGEIAAPNTGDFSKFSTVIARTKEISAGKHTLQLKITSDWVDIDNMKFEKYESNGAEPYDANGCVIGDRDNAELASIFSTISLSNVNPKVKPTTNHNPIMTQRYGADPCAMVYGDSVYIYMTHDIYEYSNGNITTNGYSKITEIVCVSSADLVNWTDHGPMKVAGSGGISKAGNSWAPTACHVTMNGKERFFLYFANGGNGIYVVASDTPYGPWEDVKNGQGLITRSMPNCNVEWLFDPAVLVDDDGTGYIYFGGGVPQGKNADPGTARIAKLGKDFISIDGSAQSLNPPYLFEDAGINKIGKNYVYSYCTNWNTGGNNIGISNAVISTMISTNPMTGFKYDRKVFDNPSKWLGSNGNNHHSFFKFKNKWYITYHSQWIQNQIGVEGGYRCSHVDYANVDESAGKIMGVDAGTTKGVSQVEPVDGTKTIQAECFAWQNGIESNYVGKTTNMAVSGKNGSWIGLCGVKAQGVNKFKARVSAPCGGAIRISTGSAGGPVIGYLNVESNSSFEEFECKLTSDIPTATDLFFTFSGELKFDSWSMYYDDPADDEIIDAVSNSLMLEPNPAKDVVKVRGLADGDIVTITSMNGVVVKAFVAESDDADVVVSDLASGIYVVSNGSNSVKLIKD